MDKNFYVYEYWRLDNNTCFYVGKGKGERYITLQDRSDWFKNILEKTECCSYIVHSNLTEKAALEIECHLIHKYVFEEGYGIAIHKNCNSGTPYLINNTWGGEGTCGYRWTEQHKEKCSGKNHHRYKNRHLIIPHNKGEVGFWSKNGRVHPKGMKGKSHTRETKKNISDKLSGKNHPMYGKYGSEAYIAKKVVCLNTLQIFGSAKDAGKYFGVDASGIGKNISGRQASAGKHPKTREKLRWVFLKDFVGDKGELNEHFSIKEKVI